MDNTWITTVQASDLSICFNNLTQMQEGYRGLNCCVTIDP